MIGIISADAAAWNEDVTRSRRALTVAQAMRINAEYEEQEAVQRSIDRAFPVLAAFREDTPRPDGGCPALDGQCTGQDCQDPREVVHHGPEHGLRVSFAEKALMPFELAQWGSDAPALAFFADGSWPELDVDQVDELLLALDEYAGALRRARQHLEEATRRSGGGR